ncbi:hypothetical protein BDF14DRAFT_1878533 [Spinellus fusiger]|nr:hypothetical protein BDF14DRAFT_1878533 [Spinellus fusiger]
MPPVTPKDSKKRSILDVKSSRITKRPVSLSTPSMAVKSTRALLLRKERTALTPSQRTGGRPPALSGPSLLNTIKKPSGEPRRSGTSTTRLPVATPLALKTPRIQPRRQNPIVSRSSQSEQPDTTTSNAVAAGTKRKSVELLNTTTKKRGVLGTTRPAAATRPPVTTPSSLRAPRIQPRKQNPVMLRSSKLKQPNTTTTTTRPPMPTPSSLRAPRIQPRKQTPIMPRSSKPEQPATTTSDTVAVRTKEVSSKSLDTNVKKRCVLNKKQELNHQEHIEAVAELSEFKANLESDVPEKDLQTPEVAERVNDLEREEQQETQILSDQVFPHENTQKECYEEVFHLAQPAPEGHTICIFAYGHTGSEKKEAPGEDRGVIPRAVHQLYDVVQKVEENNWHYKMVRQFHEIYNESIRDLLGDNYKHGKTNHEIRHEKY